MDNEWQARFNAIEERLKKASRKPWRVYDAKYGPLITTAADFVEADEQDRETVIGVSIDGEPFCSKNDLEFIIRARNEDVRWLLDEVRRLKAQLESKHGV